MKKLTKDFVINLITWAVILAAVVVVIPATYANTMPEQTSDIQENNIPETQENIEAEKSEETPYEEPAVEMTPEEQQQAKNKEVYDAVVAGDIERLKKALANGGSANSCMLPPDYDYDDKVSCVGENAFLNALRRKDYNIMKVLIESGLTPDTVVLYGDGCGDYPLTDLIIEAVNNSQDIELADFLVDNGVYPLTYSAVFFHPSCDDIPPPVRAGNQFTKHLLERGLSPAVVDLPYFMKDKPFVEYLISKGVNPTLCSLSNLEDIKWMFSKGGDLNERCQGVSFETLIEYYTESDILRFLAENGAQVSASAIRNAIGKPAILEYLVSKVKNSQDVFEEVANEQISILSRNIEKIGNPAYDFSDYLKPLAIVLKYLPGKEHCSEIITSFLKNKDKVQETKDCLIVLKQEQEQKKEQQEAE
jgi:hypothetical protein